MKGMVKNMYNVEETTDRATADDCYDRVKNKMDARLTKAATALANKEARKAKGAATTSSLITYGSMSVPLLADGSHIHRLKVPQLTAVLAFKAVEVPKGSKKADLQKLAKDALKLPMSKEPTPLLALPAPPLP